MNNIEQFNNCKVGRLTHDHTTVSTHQNINDKRPITNIFRPQPIVETITLTIKNLRKTNSVEADGTAHRFINDSLPAIAYYLTITIYLTPKINN